MVFPTLYLLLCQRIFNEAFRENYELGLPLLTVALALIMATLAQRGSGRRMQQNQLLDGVIVAVSILIVVAVWYRPTAQYPYLWHGFGGAVALTCLAIASIFVIRLVFMNQGREFTFRLSRGSAVLVSVVLCAMYLPMLLQPPWGITNAGDATHQVLEEISGPLVGHFPGINAVSTYTTLLGTPLTIFRLVPLSASIQMATVIIWTNILVILVPLGMAFIARRLFNVSQLLFGAVFVVPIVGVSGNWGAAASNFESLSMVPGRTLMPILLGGLLVYLNEHRVGSQYFAIGVVAVLTAFNNVEFGAPAALSATAFVACSASMQGNAKTKFASFVSGMLAAVSTLVVFSLLVRGKYDVWFRIGSYAGKPYSPAEEFPLWSTHNLIIAVCAMAVIVGVKGLKNSRGAASSSAIFFGLWGLLAFPYCSYRCVAGMYMSTQVYFIPAVMAGISIFALFKSEIAEVNLKIKDLARMSLPFVMLGSLAVASVVQAPSPIDEWSRAFNRVRTSGWQSDELRPMPDQWTTQQIDWLRPEDVRVAAEAIGPGSLGSFGYMGNSVELATGINNLTRINSAEVLQIKGTRKLEELACREVDESQPDYIIVVGIGFPCSGYVQDQVGGLPETVQIMKKNG